MSSQLTLPTDVLYMMYAMGIVQLLDAITTYMALKTNPNVEEGNPVIAFFLKKLGLVGGLVAKLAIAAGLLFWQHMQPSVSPIMYLVLAIYVYVIWSNYKFIKR